MIPRSLRPFPCLVAFSLLAPAVAHAEPTTQDRVAAQALFDDALKLMDGKQYPAACTKLEQSEQLDPAMGTRYRLAECYAAVGRTASAWKWFTEVAAEAHEARQLDREEAARDRATA